MKAMTRRAATALAIFAGSVAGGQSLRAEESINVAVFPGTTLSMHAIVGHEKGFCSKHGLKCELKPIASGPLALQALIGKSVDVGIIGTEIVATSVAQGADVALVSMPLPHNVQMLAIRNDVPRPNKAKGYPGFLADFKGLKIGVPARGSQAEVWLATMLKDAGLSTGDATIVGVGGPATAYTMLTASKQVDAVVVFEPIKALCNHERKCEVVVDMTIGDGPAAVKALDGVAAPFVMRGETVRSNPKLVTAFNAAMLDAAKWIHSPENFDALVAMFKPRLGYDQIPRSEELIRAWIKGQLPAFSPDLKINRKAVAATVDFYHSEVKTVPKVVPVDKLVWDKAP